MTAITVPTTCSQSRTTTYWITTIALVFAVFTGGIGELAHAWRTLETVTSLGYPSYILTILGAWKLLGAVTLVVPGLPRLKEWAYAGIFFGMTGATVSHAIKGDYGPGAYHLVATLALAGLALASWALRPQSRTLGVLFPAKAWNPRGSEANVTDFTVKIIGRIESPLTDLASAPRQADEGAPEAVLVFEPGMLPGLANVRPGDAMIVITWLDRARRDVLSVHPRGDATRAPEGVFSTRSPHRPNPIGLHETEVTAVDGQRIRVRGLEALDGTPIIDLKPVLSEDISRR